MGSFLTNGHDDAIKAFLRKIWRTEMNKTHGKTDELAAVDAVSQQRAIGLARVGTHEDDRRAEYDRGLAHGYQGGFIAGKIEILKTIGELANEMEKDNPLGSMIMLIVARQLLATLKPTGPQT